MKTVALEHAPTMLREATRLAQREVIVFTEKGRPAFALVGIKDDLALEALALRRNRAFNSYLEDVSRRARRRSYSLEEIEEEFRSPPRRKQ